MKINFLKKYCNFYYSIVKIGLINEIIEKKECNYNDKSSYI